MGMGMGKECGAAGGTALYVCVREKLLRDGREMNGPITSRIHMPNFVGTRNFWDSTCNRDRSVWKRRITEKKE